MGMVKRGHSGDMDWNLYHKKNDKLYDKQYGRVSPKTDGTHDWNNFDRPRKDVKKIKNKGGQNTYLGAKNKSQMNELTNLSNFVLAKNFSSREQRRIGRMLVNVAQTKKNWAGSHMRYNGASVITLAPTNISENVLVHEMIHADRWARGHHTRDKDIEESKTELETIARSSEPLDDFHLDGGGYYSTLPEVREVARKARTSEITYAEYKSKSNRLIKKAITEDRILLTGSMSKSLSGKQAVKSVEKNYSKSHMARANITGRRRTNYKSKNRRAIEGWNPENQDRYFEIQPKGKKRKAQAHYNFPKGKKSDIRSIKKDLHEKFGKGSKIWEWKDGKKVRVN
ncbi:MAG: hypothetical protein ACTSRU_07175 [Candidatus Hodarchaeales archaeon]